MTAENHLDREAVAELLARIRALAPTVGLLVITHDLALAEGMDRTVRLTGGTLVDELVGAQS